MTSEELENLKPGDEFAVAVGYVADDRQEMWLHGDRDNNFDFLLEGDEYWPKSIYAGQVLVLRFKYSELCGCKYPSSHGSITVEVVQD